MEQKEDLWRSARLKEIPGHIRDYIETRVELLKAQLVETAGNAASGIVLGVALGIMGLFFLLFLLVGLAIIIGEALDARWAGYLIIAGFFLLLIILLVVLKDKLITTPITNLIIQKAYTDDANGNAEEKDQQS